MRVAGSGECTLVGGCLGGFENVFSDYICSRVRVIHGDGSMVMSLLYYRGSEQTRAYMERNQQVREAMEQSRWFPISPCSWLGKPGVERHFIYSVKISDALL